ncbi:MAG TPA: ABC transporter permease [Spirochaetota bacterium]|nr:ABC transporter permease [Spirochaetota bacterium]HOM08928.1 ABC transporter permease [Spirochaetota bacterium]HPP48724.1 ABC transporter permease [Spirochaetota bacterium]
MHLFELFIGWRYLKAKKSQGFISFNTFLSIFIVAIGVFVLIVVMSVMTGFQSQIRDKILDVDAHITISRYYADTDSEGIANYRELSDKIKNVKQIKTIMPFVQGQGLVRVKSYIFPVAIRGYGNPGEVPKDITKFITAGDKDFKNATSIAIGEEMAFNYNLRLGDYIEIIVPKGRLTAREGITPGIGRYRIASFFKTGYYDFDTKLILLTIPQTQRLFGIGNIVSGLALKLFDVYDMDRTASLLQSIIGYDYQVITAEQQNQNLFYALRLEKLIMTIILFLVIISASFTIMGTLVMVVMEKRKAIGILKAMGAQPYSIMIIFILEGFFIGLIGAIIGVITGLATAINLEAIIHWVERVINSIMSWIYITFDLGVFYPVSLVPKNVYYIDSLPTQIQPEFVMLVAILAIFIATVAAILPSWHASRLHPVESIRYE